MGRRRSAARSIGGMANVVTTAVATIMVKRLSLEQAHGEADGGDDDLGRAARVHGAAERHRLGAAEPADLGADEGAAELADAGKRDERDRQSQQIGLGQDREIGGEPRHAEEDRGEEAEDQAPQLLVDMLGEEGRFTDEHAGDEGAQHRLDADEIGDQRHHAGDQQNDADDRGLAAEVVVGPADELVDRHPPHRQADEEEDPGAQDALAPGRERRLCRGAPG